MRALLFILMVTGLSASCTKDNAKPGESVDIYLLKSYRNVTGKCQVDASASVLEDIPTIKNQDIIAYSKTDYQFTLTDNAIQKVKAFRDNTPFAVTVDTQVIYYGYFKPGISSSSCDNSITMDVAWGTPNKISLKLGYPGLFQGATIDDQRNNPKLISTLRRQGKLK